MVQTDICPLLIGFVSQLYTRTVTAGIEELTSSPPREICDGFFLSNPQIWSKSCLLELICKIFSAAKACINCEDGPVKDNENGIATVFLLPSRSDGGGGGGANTLQKGAEKVT